MLKRKFNRRFNRRPNRGYIMRLKRRADGDCLARGGTFSLQSD